MCSWLFIPFIIAFYLPNLLKNFQNMLNFQQQIKASYYTYIPKLSLFQFLITCISEFATQRTRINVLFKHKNVWPNMISQILNRYTILFWVHIPRLEFEQSYIINNLFAVKFWNDISAFDIWIFPHLKYNITLKLILYRFKDSAIFFLNFIYKSIFYHCG